ncbi:glycosyltransferase family 4 protein [Algicola sagamiensis]|uniref:glycosyltransferase family 4 protein n=1 Tax=Algicola sagamiensis TaxID=163869 RepID=UPI0003814037|nr:glycosyltransferase family 4 protein [Algicola sagamiensis]
MRVLVLTFYYEPDLCAGSFRATALVNKLKEQLPKDAEIDIVTSQPNRYQSFAHQVEAFEKRQNINIWRVSLPKHKSGMVDQVIAFNHFYRKVMQITQPREYDLIFATSSRLFTAFLGARIADRKKIPLYLDIRDIFVDTLKDVLNRKLFWLLFPFLRGIEHYTFGRATRINLVSEGFRTYFNQYFQHRQYDVFTNGIDATFLRRQDIQEAVSPSAKKKLLYAGNIGEGQGLHRIIPQLAQLIREQFEIVIIGDGGRVVQLKEALAKLNIQNVTLLPPVKQDELVAHYQQADVLFLHLNDHAAFQKVLPSKIFEYAAMEKPILAGVSGYAATFIERYVENAQLFSPCQPEDAKQALQRLDLQRTERRQFIQQFNRQTITTAMARSIIAICPAKEELS